MMTASCMGKSSLSASSSYPSCEKAVRGPREEGMAIDGSRHLARSRTPVVSSDQGKVAWRHWDASQAILGAGNSMRAGCPMEKRQPADQPRCSRRPLLLRVVLVRPDQAGNKSVLLRPHLEAAGGDLALAALTRQGGENLWGNQEGHRL